MSRPLIALAGVLALVGAFGGGFIAEANGTSSGSAATCAHWDLSGVWNAHQSNGVVGILRFTFKQSATGRVTGDASYSGASGPLSGSLTGSKLDFIVSWSDGQRGHYFGTVSARSITGNGFAVADPSITATWSATGTAVCKAETTAPKTTPTTKTTPKTQTTPSKKGVTCLPADCSGLQLTVKPTPSGGLTGVTMNAGCGEGSGAVCDLDASLELDLSGLQSSDKETQLRAQQQVAKDLAGFDEKVSNLEADTQEAIRAIERDSAATPPSPAEVQKDVDRYDSLIEETLGKSAARDAAEDRAAQDLASSDPEIQARGQRELAESQIEFQSEIDRIQAGAQAAETALRADSPNAHDVSDSVGDDLSDLQEKLQQAANDADSSDAAMERAYRDLSAPDRATQQRGQQEMLQAQQRLQAEITGIQRAGDAAQATIHNDPSTPRAVTQDVNAMDSRYQGVASSAESLDAAEAEAYRNLTSSDPATQRRGQQDLRNVQGQFQHVSNQIQQYGADAAAEIQSDASFPPGAGSVGATAQAIDDWLPDYDTAGYGEAGGPYQSLDSATGGIYPATGSSSSNGAMQRATASATIKAPKARAVIDSIYSKHPRASDVSAFKTAVRLATARKYSPARVKARLELTLAQHIGHAELLHELGYDLRTRRGGHNPIVLGKTAAHIRAGSNRSVTTRPATLGARILRLLDLYSLSHPTTVRFHVVSKLSGKISTTSEQIAVG